MEEFKPKRGQECILYDRICTECGECMMCDLDPTKKCDNCGKCLEEMMPETNKKGFVEIPVEFDTEADNAEENDEEDGLSPELKELFAAYGMPVSTPKHEHDHHNHNCDCDECHDDDDCSDPNCGHHHRHKH